MPNYRDIYNDIVSNNHRYNLAENSPGLRAVIQSSDQLEMLSGRSLDVGCGVGFVVEYLSNKNFDLTAFGVDVSDCSIEKAYQRLENISGSSQRLMVIDSQTLPFEDNYFSLVTCFDMFEHLDVVDIDTTWKEIQRVLRPGGVFFGSVSCRLAGSTDLNGDNLHRTVKSPDWWIDRIAPDRAEYDGHRIQLSLWKHVPLTETNTQPALAEAQNSIAQATVAKSSAGVLQTHGAPVVAAGVSAESDMSQSGAVTDPTAHSTADLYQRIYDENKWYGDADQGRSPGVRLLPHYQEWLMEPVMDLGCGRGQTVEHLRNEGMQAEGIDQIQNNPGMRVGDITQPISDLSDFNSVICIDCIEHLYEEQVLALFENMKQAGRQAFSIHNGESTGTGQELHVNRQSFQEWAILIRKHFDIAAAIEISHEQVLYLTQSKPQDD